MAVRDIINKTHNNPQSDKIQVKTARNAIETAIRRENGSSLNEVANDLGVDKKSVVKYEQEFKRILPHFGDQNRIDWFRKNRANIYTILEDLAAESLANKIRAGDGNARELTAAVKMLHSIGRLEKGQSTGNIEHRVHNEPKQPESIQALIIEPPSELEE